MTEQQSALRTLAVKSAAWYGATRLWGQLISWGVTVLLARLLAPEDYGLYAIALSVLAMVELLQEFGLGTALIQRQNLTREQISAVFWVVASTSLLLTGVTVAASGPISRIYGEPALTWPLRLLCLTFLLNSLGTVPYSLLTKSINLRRRSLAEAFGVTTSALVALGLAYMGYGVGALVAGHLARSVVLNVGLAFFAGWAPTLAVDFRGMRGLLTFGVSVAGSQLVSTFTATTNTFVIARLLTSTAVGLFSMAQGLTEAPTRLSTAIINQISLPVFAKLQHERDQLTAYFLKISKYLTVVSLPIQIGLALVAPEFIPILLSAKWQALTVPFQIMCLESAVILSTLTCSPLLMARGRGSLLLNRALLWFFVVIGATAAGAWISLVAVMVMRLIVVVPLRLTLVVPALTEVDLSVGEYLRGLASPLGATALMVVSVVFVQHGLPFPMSPVEGLVAEVLAGAATYLVALFLLDRTLGSELRIVARELLSGSRA
jgi:O-antigen/teichoic acid export membrane protein